MFQALEERCNRVQASPIFPRIMNENRVVESLENIETLEGHYGCVNTLRWNKSGNLLASGSDDHQVKIWRAGAEKLNIDSGHEGNVFAVEFLPYSDDRVIVSGAADRVILLHDLETNTRKRWESEGRIKRICTVEHDPYMFWAASEADHRVVQFDTRIGEPETVVQRGASNPRQRHVKSIAISEAKPNLLVVGYDETPVRLFDRRRFDEPILTFSPLDTNFNAFHATHVAFNKIGTEVVVNHGNGGGVFVFGVDSSLDPQTMQRFHAVLDQPKEPAIVSQLLPHPQLREIGSDAIREKHFGQAIDHYSELIQRNDSDRAFRSVCHSNRGTALLMRRLRGDTYACIRDCVTALEIHRGNSKALFRLCKSFALMEHVRLARKCIEKFKEWFPEQSIARIEQDVDSLEVDEDAPELESAGGVMDYKQRFIGSSNNQTDIKEANFFGSRDQYIVAGSDCGHMYIWNRDTLKIMGIWHADDNICNIVQPHPNQFLIASSGIDSEIRLWQPQLEREEDFESKKVEDPYDFMEKKYASAPTHQAQLHYLRGYLRERPQCVQS